MPKIGPADHTPHSSSPRKPAEVSREFISTVEKSADLGQDGIEACRRFTNRELNLPSGKASASFENQKGKRVSRGVFSSPFVAYAGKTLKK